jgi:1,4-dihydroxy-6-naphthoate synthase
MVKGHIPVEGFKLQPEILADVETLNEWALEGRLDITKLSFHALGYVLDDYALLHAGAALGRGCGPLLVSKKNVEQDKFSQMSVAVPGRYTTAAMLLNLFAPSWKNIVEMRFDEIMGAIEGGRVDCGVIIHESRFTYQGRGLQLITDLGTWWEGMSGYPIPLGGIAVKRSLGNDLIQKIDKAVRDSLAWVNTNPLLCRSYIKEHSQELEDDVIGEHIGLYVNSFSEDLGTEGLAAVEFFLKKGREIGMLPDSLNNLPPLTY